MHEAITNTECGVKEFDELEPIILATVSEVTGSGGDSSEDDNVVWANFL